MSTTTGGDRQHAFTRVDEEPRPAAWVECLDRFHREPFYREYKQRVREILDPHPSRLYLEVGSGTGTDALALAAGVLAVDRSFTMCREAVRRGLRSAVMADAGHLPLPGELVDGCWADRTFQHLADPAGTLRELVRVMKPGARIVVVDPDYGTQTMALPDPLLAGKVMAFRADRMLRNGRLAHRMGQLFVEAALAEVTVEERTLTVRDPTSLDHVLGLRSWARTALADGVMTASEVDRWEILFDEVATNGTFAWSVAFYITSGRKRPFR